MWVISEKPRVNSLPEVVSFGPTEPRLATSSFPALITGQEDQCCETTGISCHHFGWWRQSWFRTCEFQPLLCPPVLLEQGSSRPRLYRESCFIFHFELMEHHLFLGKIRNMLVSFNSKLKTVHLWLCNFLHFFWRYGRSKIPSPKPCLAASAKIAAWYPSCFANRDKRSHVLGEHGHEPTQNPSL
jgi:hypothetical protein